MTTKVLTALLAQAVIDQVNVQKFTSSGTYTPTAGCVYAIIEVQAAGGNGSGIASGVGGGGGSGGYGRSLLLSPTTQTITIGAVGSNTTYGSLITCTSGGNGVSIGSGASTGGAGGTSSGGNLDNISGQTGDNGYAGSPAWSGRGANSRFGQGGISVASNSTGNPASGYGAGGGGAINSTTVGAGAPGVIYITEFISV